MRDFLLLFDGIDLYMVRAIQAKQFNEANHTISTDFIHSILKHYYGKENKPCPEWLNRYLLNDSIISCLFGEHLLVSIRRIQSHWWKHARRQL